METVGEKGWKKQTALFLCSQTISIFGSSVVGFAIIWYITLKTSSGSLMAISILCMFLPQILISLFAGVWADRYSRKMLIMGSDLFIGISTLILALLFLSGYESFPLLFLISAVRSAGSGIQVPAASAILPQIVPAEHLTRINGINNVAGSVTMLLSPAAGGILLGTLGFSYALLFDTVTAFAAVLVLRFLRMERAARSEEPESTLKELGRGISYVKGSSLLKFLLIFYGLFFFLITPAAFLTPLMVERSFGSEVWRLTFNELSWTIGTLLGGIFVSVKGQFQNKLFAMAVSCLGFGVAFFMLGIAGQFVLYLGIMLAAGFFMPVFSTAEVVLIQENVEPQMLGRVFSMIQIIASAAMPLGMVIFGPMGDRVKIEYLMMGTGFLLALLSLLVFRNKKLLNR